MKHGIESHFVRPEAVYATSVLTPIVGYQPVDDAYQMAARFVAGGQGLAGASFHGFAGLRGESMFPGTYTAHQSTSLYGPRETVLTWLRARYAAVQTHLATVKVRVQAKRVEKQLRKLPPQAAPQAQANQAMHQLDTSPRGPMPYAGALPVQAGWAPHPQSPASEAAKLHGGQGPQNGAPMLPAVAAAGQIAAEAAFAPSDFWRNVMAGMPPTVAARSQNDVLFKFYANRYAGAGY
jgi:hypothetical protein